MKKDSKTKIARVYAQALYEAAVEKKTVEKVSEDIIKLHDIISADADIVKNLANPLWAVEDKVSALKAVAAKLKLDAETLNCLNLIAENGRFAEMAQILDAFKHIYYAKHGITEVEVGTVKALSAIQDKKLKANPATKDIPIVFLTARDTENDTVTGFNLGADDYISKPFSIREVLVRIRAVLRRTAERNGEPQANMLSYQGLELNLDKKTVSIDGEEVPFTKTEFEILHLLLDEKGRVFSRQELIDRIWPKDVLVLDRTVDVNITRLRKKIGKFSKCIVTRLGFGYYFDA